MRFFTNDLFNKWGFGDGEMLDELLNDINRDVLAVTIIRHVIPSIDQHIELIKVESWYWTSHNPIRAEKINGVEINEYDLTPYPTLTPDFVDVDDTVILAIAQEIAAAKAAQKA